MRSPTTSGPDRSGAPGRPASRWAKVTLLAGCLAATVMTATAATPTAASPTRWPAVAVELSGPGVIGHLRLAPDDRLGVTFIHSVDTLPVQDWYLLREGQLVQESTRLIQFGAGMGHIPGQGTGRADGGWWEVTGLDRPVGTLVLRIGPASVDHRLRHPTGEIRLSDCWPGQRLTLRPAYAAHPVDAGHLVRAHCAR